MNQSIKLLLLCFIGVLMCSGNSIAQVSEDSELFKALKKRDSVLFEIGFNKCEVQKSAELVSDDLEFYHDKSGVSNSKEEFISIMENGLCHPNRTKQIYRKLVTNSLQIFALYNDGKLYGALQNGKHFFTERKDISYDESDNYALFSHLWIIKNKEWKLKRVISYDHSSKDVKSK